MVDLILFADNYWLVATSPRMLEKATVAWLSLLGEYGWETPDGGAHMVRHAGRRRRRANLH